MILHDCYNFEISIHAPARGATYDIQMNDGFTNISIHAPARGATRSSVLFYTCCTTFQSTLPRGERLQVIIHLKLLDNFNPRSREGSDASRLYDDLYTLSFQSTLPRGERQRASQDQKNYTRFQSTLPRGERLWESVIIRG